MYLMHSIDTGYINLRFFSLSPNHPEVQTTSTILLLFYRLRTCLPVCLNCLLTCLLVQSPILNSVTSQSQKNITAGPANQTFFPGSQNAKYVSFKTRAGQGKAGQQQRRVEKEHFDDTHAHDIHNITWALRCAAVGIVPMFLRAAEKWASDFL